MTNFNYPIRIIKKKMRLDSYKPMILDCKTGQQIKINTKEPGSITYFIFNMALLLLTLAIVYFIIVMPVLETSLARSEVSKSLELLSSRDAGVLEDLRSKGEVVSENVTGDLVTLVLRIEDKKEKEFLKLAFMISTIEEVTTDGKTISITFLSSAK